MRILASRFIQLDPMIGPVYFPLKRGEFIQGLLGLDQRQLARVYRDRARSGRIRGQVAGVAANHVAREQKLMSRQRVAVDRLHTRPRLQSCRDT